MTNNLTGKVALLSGGSHGIGAANSAKRLGPQNAGGENVIVADRTVAKAANLATELGGKATPMAVADAISKADVVILATYFDAIKELLATHRGALAGKVVVDPSNPIVPDGNGGFSPVSVGGIDQSIRIEVGGDLHEFGKVGKLVSAQEAEALV
ncbi:MAG TPA: NAD(P)-binding domain-containing protein [Chthoniobacterales bacterium]